MKTKNPKQELEILLREIYDDDDFVFCTLNGLNDAKSKKIIDYINISKERNESATYEDIVCLSLIIEKE